MIVQLAALAAVAHIQGNAALALRHTQHDPALSRYFGSLAALDIMPEAARLGEGHAIAWVFMPNEPLKPILFERTPRWSRLVKFDIATKAILWKAQLYASKSPQKGSLDELLGEFGLGAVLKSGPIHQFEADFAYRVGLSLYEYRAPVGILRRTVYQLGEPKRTESFEARSEQELRKLGFP